MALVRMAAVGVLLVRELVLAALVVVDVLAARLVVVLGAEEEEAVVVVVEAEEEAEGVEVVAVDRCEVRTALLDGITKT